MVGLIAHEWIAPAGGSENVLALMANAHPSADIVCLWNDDKANFASGRVKESWMASTPLRGRKALAVPFMPSTWRAMSIKDYDWTLVSTHAFAHHIGSPSERRSNDVFTYVHTPARYVWAAELDERGRGTAARMLSPVLKSIDRRRANEGPVYAANSKFIQERIAAAWGVESEVIYPPVAVERIRSIKSWADHLHGVDEALLEGLPDEFVLGASRFVPYKRLDDVIAVGEALGIAVVLAGRGPDEQRLRARAATSSVDVSFIDRPSNDLLYALYERASLFVFPAVEDFGIMPVEAMAIGTPVLVNSRGGAVESVGRLRGGAVSDFSDLAQIRRSALQAIEVNMDYAIQQAEVFSESTFVRNLSTWMHNYSKGSANG
jgi:glycosyltransferase involved in cell wall biosynthesis